MDQTLAVDLLKSGKNIFLTGQAGSGKTYVINQYVKWLWTCGIDVALTASTGIAATHIGGVTIHSRSGIGIKEHLTDHDMELLQQKEHLHKTITKAQVLIIDEISMLSAYTIDSIDRVVKMIRRDGRPFGGLQVVMVGDFFQLPAIMSNHPDASSTKRFAFASNAWKELDLTICYLHTQYRQQAGQFGRLLESLRKGTLSAQESDLLRKRMNVPIPVGTNPVKLYTHNVDVDRINAQELAKLSGEDYFFSAIGSGDKKLVTTLKKSMLAPELLELKEGAKVIFVRNNPQKGYFNGTTGIIERFDTHDGFPIVKTQTGQEIKAEPELRSIENADAVVASVKQVPLKLAWAITVHKSQGMTLDAAEMDLSKVFEPGQGYVALSRIKSIEGLYLRGLNEQGLHAHPLVVRADTYFQEQSADQETLWAEMSSEDWKNIHTHFVTTLGGVYASHSIEKEKTPAPQATKKVVKGDSIKKTMHLIVDGSSFEEIVQIRGLASSTILEHIFKIHELYPEVSLEQFAPPTEMIDTVNNARKTIPKTETGKLKALYNTLGGTLSYEQIKLCLLFV